MKSTVFYLFQCFLAVFLCYSAAVSVYLSFLQNQYFDFLTVFFVLALISFALFSIWQIYQNVKKSFEQRIPKVKIKSHRLFVEKFKKNKKLLTLLTLCFMSLSVGFFNIYTQYSRGLDVAETGQLSASLHQNIIEASRKQQQPSLDYYFSSFSHELWGMNKFSVRFHAMVFYLILSLILPLMLWFFCPSFWAAALGILFFSINHIVRLNSVNGRPLSLVLLTGSLFLFFYMDYCNKNRKEQNLFPVFASQYLFVMSIGFQPIVFIASLFVSSFWLLIKSKKVIFKKLFFSLV